MYQLTEADVLQEIVKSRNEREKRQRLYQAASALEVELKQDFEDADKAYKRWLASCPHSMAWAKGMVFADGTPKLTCVHCGFVQKHRGDGGKDGVGSLRDFALGMEADDDQ